MSTASCNTFSVMVEYLTSLTSSDRRTLSCNRAPCVGVYKLTCNSCPLHHCNSKELIAVTALVDIEKVQLYVMNSLIGR
jgi:hypothetical protein